MYVSSKLLSSESPKQYCNGYQSAAFAPLALREARIRTGENNAANLRGVRPFLLEWATTLLKRVRRESRRWAEVLGRRPTRVE